MSQLMETFVLKMNGKEVVVNFVPKDESPMRKIDVGNASITVDGTTTDYEYTKTSFVPMPFPFIKK